MSGEERPGSQPTPAERWARAWARALQWQPRRLAVGSGLALVVVAAIFVFRFHFASDISDLLPQDSRAAQAFDRLREHFEHGDQLILLATVPEQSAGELGPWANAVVKGLQALPQVRRASRELVPSLDLANEGPPLDFTALGPDFARRVATALQAEGIRTRLERSLQILSSSPGLDTSTLVQRDPLILRELLPDFARERFTGGEGGVAESEETSFATILVEGRRPAQDLQFARELVAAVEREWAQVPGPEGLRVAATGGYAIAVEDEARIKGDMISTTGATLLLITLVFWSAFGGWRPLAHLNLVLMLGVASGYAVFLLVRGGLTVLTAVAAAVLFGLGIDFGTHLFAEWRDARLAGATVREALEWMLVRAGPRVALATLTSIVCVLSFALTGFRGLADLGLLLACGLVTTFAWFVTLFPWLIARWPPAVVLAGRTAPLASVAQTLATWPGRAPWTVAALALGLTVASGASLVQHGLPPFRSDLRELHQEGSRALATLAELDQLLDVPLVPWIVYGEAGDGDELMERFAALGTELEPLAADGGLESVVLPDQFLPPSSRRRAARAELAKLDPDQFVRDFDRAVQEVGFVAGAFAQTREQVRQGLTAEDLSFAENVAAWPSELIDRFVRLDAKSGTARAAGFVLVPPERSESTRRSVEELLAGNPSLTLTGYPVVAAELNASVRRDFRWATGLALAGVFVLLIVTTRSLRSAALVVVPIGCGLLWLLGWMSAFEHGFNVMNLAVLPMIIGLGIDDGIHLVMEWRRDGDRARALQTVTLPMLLTTLTTMIGFGSLLLVAHPAVASIGLLATVGAGACFLATLTALPVLLGTERRNKG